MKNRIIKVCVELNLLSKRLVWYLCESKSENYKYYTILIK